MALLSDLITLFGLSVLVLPSAYLLILAGAQWWLWFPALLAGYVLSMILFKVVLALVPPLKEGEYDYPKSSMFLNWGFRFAFKRALSWDFLSEMIGSFGYLRVLYFWALGARVDSITAVASDLSLRDPSLVHIGKGVVIGSDVIIGSHMVTQTKIVLGKVEIGSQAQIGYGTEIGPSTIIEERAVVGPRCSVFGKVRIGSETVIGSNVTIGLGVKIGSQCVIEGHVRIEPFAELADQCIVKSGSVIKRKKKIESGTVVKP